MFHFDMTAQAFRKTIRQKPPVFNVVKISANVFTDMQFNGKFCLGEYRFLEHKAHP